jgi:peptidoglycan/xylan/chitin deacetylase (PgdA/CDA1 family)
MKKIILCYHGIDEKNSNCNVSWSLFQDQIHAIGDLNYKIVSTKYIIQSTDISRSLAITFDDGLETSLQAIIWLLEKGFPVLWSVLALPNSSLHYGLHGKLVPLKTVSTLLNTYPSLEIASHALTHRHLTKIPLVEAHREIEESRDRLQNELQTTVRYFVYPFGNTNKDLSRLVKATGYEAAFTTTAIPMRSGIDRYALPRLCVNEELYPQDRLRNLLSCGGGVYLNLASCYRKFVPTRI